MKAESGAAINAPIIPKADDMAMIMIRMKTGWIFIVFERMRGDDKIPNYFIRSKIKYSNPQGGNWGNRESDQYRRNGHNIKANFGNQFGKKGDCGPNPHPGIPIK